MAKRIGIICAGDREFEPFIPHIQHAAILEKAMLRIWRGRIGEVEVAALFSGVCKVNAAVAAQVLIDCCHVDVIINVGTAGGLRSDIALFDVAISTEAVYHDVAEHILTEFHPWLKENGFRADDELLQLSHVAVDGMENKSNVHWGRMATGEAFIEDERREAILCQYNPLTVDMETASIAHVCYVNGIPFLAIRCITDDAQHNGIRCFEENCARASGIAKDVALAVLERIAQREKMRNSAEEGRGREENDHQ